MAYPVIPRPRLPRLATRIAIAVAQFAVVFGFAVAGTVFFGLAIASPMGMPIAERRGVALTSADIAIVQQIGSLWWLFAVGTVLSFGAALATIGSMMQRLAAPRA